MKRIEVRLSLQAVRPLLEVLRSAGNALRDSLAAAPLVAGLEPEFQDAWNAELLASQNSEVRALLALFGTEFEKTGVIGFDEENAEAIVRATAALRLQLRARHFSELSDEDLETDAVELDGLPEGGRKAYLAYLFLRTLQDLVIRHLDSSILGGGRDEETEGG